MLYFVGIFDLLRFCRRCRIIDLFRFFGLRINYRRKYASSCLDWLFVGLGTNTIDISPLTFPQTSMFGSFLPTCRTLILSRTPNKIPYMKTTLLMNREEMFSSFPTSGDLSLSNSRRFNPGRACDTCRRLKIKV